ncbi:triacylglycerol lipase 2-like [Arachis stenosperma]|uniref:triacylglycerol lipase 2-like n=1 Tax=Arachis stenosperma TaxID=217475 RepID=UPI0025AB9644|nr:triacylglycerol lipase 2-like [Arachis stenosperma]
MANIVTSLLLVLLIRITPVHGRKPLQENNELPASSSIAAADTGICKIMVEKNGYTCEEHKVTTEDGYILSLQRMPKARSGKAANKPPVFLQHGLFVDGIIWLYNNPEESLGYILADNGYDVWIANSRGSRYSKGHTSLAPDETAYWDWSWDQLLSYDLPASVGYVFKHTGQKMHYVGHSLGTLIGLGAFSENQLLNMLRSAALLSPIAHLNHITSPPSKVAGDLFMADKAYWLGIRKIVPNEAIASKLLKKICKALKPRDCSNMLDLFTGPNCCINGSRLELIATYEPQASSTKNLIHLSQNIRTGKITKYNYGHREENIQHYGQPNPPPYDMANIPKEFPLFFGYGGTDMLADVTDVQILLSELKDHDRNKLVQVFIKDYAHGDFVMAVNAHKLVYDPLMSFIAAN